MPLDVSMLRLLAQEQLTTLLRHIPGDKDMVQESVITCGEAIVAGQGVVFFLLQPFSNLGMRASY